jgi:hypothetical protein
MGPRLPETNSWFEIKDGAIKIWPREGEPVTVPGSIAEPDARETR